MLADLYTCAGRNEAAIDLLLGLVREVEALVREGKGLGAEAGEEVRQLGKAYYLLGQNYREVGELREGAEWFERLGNLRTDGTSRASGLIEAARLYLRLGDEQKANELYDQVAQYGNGWLTGVAICDRAAQLIDKEQHQEARSLLAGQGFDKFPESIKVALYSLLGYSFYKSGEFQQAEEYCNAAIECYEHEKALKGTLPPGENIEAPVHTAHLCLDWIQRWRESRVVLSPPQINVTISRDDEVVNRLVVIRAFSPLPLTARSPGPGIQVRLNNNWSESPQGWFYYERLWVEIFPGSLSGDTDHEVPILDANTNSLYGKLLVRIRVGKPLSEN